MSIKPRPVKDRETIIKAMVNLPPEDLSEDHLREVQRLIKEEKSVLQWAKAGGKSAKAESQKKRMQTTQEKCNLKLEHLGHIEDFLKMEAPENASAEFKTLASKLGVKNAAVPKSKQLSLYETYMLETDPEFRRWLKKNHRDVPVPAISTRMEPKTQDKSEEDIAFEKKHGISKEEYYGV